MNWPEKLRCTEEKLNSATLPLLPISNLPLEDDLWWLRCRRNKWHKKECKYG